MRAALHSYGMPIRGPTTLYDEQGIITTVAADIVSQTEFDQRTADGADTAQTQGVDEPGAAPVANANADGRVDPAIVKQYYESDGRKQSFDSKWSRFCRYDPERIEANLRAIGCTTAGAEYNVVAVQGKLPDLLQYVADHLDALAAHYTVPIASKEVRQSDSAAMYAAMDAVMVKVWKQLRELRGGFMRLQVFDGKCLTVGVDVPTVAVVELDGADVERIKAKDQGFVDLVRNGPLECPIHLVSRPQAQRRHDLAPLNGAVCLPCARCPPSGRTTASSSPPTISSAIRNFRGRTRAGCPDLAQTAISRWPRCNPCSVRGCRRTPGRCSTAWPARTRCFCATQARSS